MSWCCVIDERDHLLSSWERYRPIDYEAEVTSSTESVSRAGEYNAPNFVIVLESLHMLVEFIANGLCTCDEMPSHNEEATMITHLVNA